MTSLRIAMLSPFPPLKGGIARFSERLGRAFGEEGCEVIPVTFRSLWPRWLMKGRPASEPYVPVLHDTQLSLDLLNPLSWLTVARRLRADRPDVLLFAYWSGVLAPLCMIIRRASGLKTVVLLHNFTSHETIPGESMLKRMLVASSEGFITLSRTVETELRVFSPEAKSRCLFHPLYERQGSAPSKPEARQDLGLPRASKVLLFFGYIREYKGVDTLLETMAIVLRRDSSVRLVVAGEFILDSSVFRHQAERLGITGQVDFYEGYVPSGQVARLMAAADAVVLPYRSASQSGIVSLAFGHGVPVIAFSIGALGDQIEHGRTGWLVREYGADALAAGILDFFREREHLPLNEGIDEACRRNSWNRFASESVDFLEQCRRRDA